MKLLRCVMATYGGKGSTSATGLKNYYCLWEFLSHLWTERWVHSTLIISFFIYFESTKGDKSISLHLLYTTCAIFCADDSILREFSKTRKVSHTESSSLFDYESLQWISRTFCREQKEHERMLGTRWTLRSVLFDIRTNFTAANANEKAAGIFTS